MRTKFTPVFWLIGLAFTWLAPIGPVPLRADETSQVFTDTDGDTYQVILKGPGHVAITQMDTGSGQGPIASLVVSGTTPASKLSIVVTQAGGGDGKVGVGSLTGDTALGSFSAPAASLDGTGIDLPAGLGSAVLSDIGAGSAVESGKNRQLPQLRLTTGAIGADFSLECPDQTLTLTAASVGSDAEISVKNAAVKITAGGFSGLLVAENKIVSFSITGGDLDGTLTAQVIGPIRVLKDAALDGGNVTASVIAALKIGPVTIAGDVTLSKILAGTQLGTDFAIGGTGSASDSFNAGSIGSVRIGGNVTNSILGAGYTPVDLVFGNSNDGIFGGNRSKFGSLTITGMLDSGSRVGAGVFSRVSIDRVVVKPRTDPRFVLRRLKKGFVPRDPSTIAPTLSRTVSTNLFAATSFLFKGRSSIQPGIKPGAIKPDKISVIRGTVRTRGGGGLAGVTVSVLDHPELGETGTRNDGSFDIAVNGGRELVLIFENDGFMTAQRRLVPAQQDYSMLDDVVLVPADPAVTAVSLGAAAPMQLHNATVQNDASGSRHAALLFPPGTTATAMLPDGTSEPLSMLHVRATEFTVGSDGPGAMPGVLPGTSQYTYCAEFSGDEADAMGATTVQFNQPVFFYLENFLNFNVGIDIPSGAYDKTQGQWVAGPSGRIIQILSITSGRADLDVDGDGIADTGTKLTDLGITDAERTQLATSYSAGQSLWRVPIPHFSGWDSNWGWGPPPDAGPPPPGPPPFPDDNCNPDDPDDPLYVYYQSQAVGESVPVSGTPFSLNYRSDRVAGYKPGNVLNIPLSVATIPASLKRIDVSVSVAGRSFTQSYPATANQTAIFQWDGQDAYSRSMQGLQPAIVRIGYVYNGSYNQTARFGYNGNGIPISADRTRMEITLSGTQLAQMGSFDIGPQSIGEWTFNVHHAYDPIGRRLHLGDGRTRTAGSVNSLIGTTAGSGMPFSNGFVNDGIPATQARLLFPFGIDIAPNGTIFFSDAQLHQIFRVDTSGIIHIVAGKPGISGASGDGGPAINALLHSPEGLALTRDGRLIFSDWGNFRVRQISPDGTISAFAGTGAPGFAGDGGLATQAQVRQVIGVTVGADGTVYLADGNNHRMRAVGTDGIIRTVAGTGVGGFNGDNIQATQAQIGPFPQGITADDFGNFYIADTGNRTVRMVGPDGFITTIAGTTGQQLVNPTDPGGDGGPATSALFNAPVSISVDRDGSIYLADPGARRFRKFTRGGLIYTFAGTGDGSTDTTAANGDNGAAPQAVLGTASPFSGAQYSAVGPNGSLYITDGPNHRIRRIVPPLPGFSGTEFAIPSEDGRQIYHFDSTGRHLETLNAITGAMLYRFTYNSLGQIASITDANANVTTIQRTLNGAPTAITGPFGARTVLGTDENGALTSVQDPSGGTYNFTYATGGLIQNAADPVGNSSTFTYDSEGRLTSGSLPAGESISLAVAEIPTGFTVTTGTALGIARTFQVAKPSKGGELRTNSDSFGVLTTHLEDPKGAVTFNSRDGMSAQVTTGPDPRFALGDPLNTHTTTSTPGGVTRNVVRSETAALGNPTNPFSETGLGEVTTINGISFTRAFDAATATFSDTTPLSRQSSLKVDSQGRLVEATTASGVSPIAISYGGRGNIAALSASTGTETRKAAFGSHLGYTTTFTDELGNVETYTRNPAGLVTERTRPDGSKAFFGYDAANRLVSITPPGRPAHTFTRTWRAKLATYTAPDAGSGPAVTTYNYDADGRLVTITYPGGDIVGYGYDSSDRISTRTVNGAVTNFAYSPTAGTLTSITPPSGDAITFTYDGSIVTGTTWSGTVTGSVSLTLDNFLRAATQSVDGTNPVPITYDSDGDIIAVGALGITHDPQTGVITATTLGQVTDTRGYDAFGEMTSYHASAGSTSLLSIQSTYDKAGRITRSVESVQGGTANTFDYTYDQLGRLIQVKENNTVMESFTYDANGNRLTAGTVSSTYDAQDRLTQSGSSTSFTYTARGNRLTRAAGAGTTTYTHDGRGSLVSVAQPSVSEIEYVYDPLLRRIGKKIGGTLGKGFLYDDRNRIVAELDGSNTLVSRFIYADGRTVPMCMLQGANIFRFITDLRGSVRLVVNTGNGAVAQRLDYSAYGEVTTDTQPGFQPFGFAGGHYDPDTGLTHLGRRDYDATNGVWLEKDPRLFAGRQFNLYAYVADDPVNRIDPSGIDYVQVGTYIGLAGHTSINVDGDGFKGFYPNHEFNPSSLTDNNLGQIKNEDRAPDSIIQFDITPDQARIIRDFISEQQGKRRYQLFFSNCTDFVLEALQKSDVLPKSPIEKLIPGLRVPRYGADAPLPFMDELKDYAKQGLATQLK